MKPYVPGWTGTWLWVASQVEAARLFGPRSLVFLRQVDRI